MHAAELRGGNKPSLNEALGWIGSRVDDIYGANVGRLDDVWIDPGSGAPRWLLVKEGRFGGRTTLIPFEDATAGAGHVWIPYERDVVREAPEVAPGAPLTQQVEAALRRHYRAKTGTGVSRVGHARHSAAPAAPVEAHHDVPAHAYSEPSPPRPPARQPAYAHDRPQYAGVGADSPSAEQRREPAAEAYPAFDPAEQRSSQAYASPPPTAPAHQRYGPPPSASERGWRQPAAPEHAYPQPPQPPEHERAYREQQHAPTAAPDRGPDLAPVEPSTGGQEREEGPTEAAAADASADAASRSVAVPVIHGLDRPYRIEIQLEGDLRISGELKDFRLTPSERRD
jgi:sporulation protein YlmC with PRC-barrel domain